MLLHGYLYNNILISPRNFIKVADCYKRSDRSLIFFLLLESKTVTSSGQIEHYRFYHLLVRLHKSLVLTQTNKQTNK